MKWLRHLARRTKSPVKVRLLHSSLTLDDWLSSPARIDYARRLYSEPAFRALLSVLHNEAPIPNVAAAPEALANQAALVAGYMQCFNTLLALAVPPPAQSEAPAATYDSPESLVTTEDMGDLG